MNTQLKRLSNRHRRRSEQPFYLPRVYPWVTPPMMPCQLSTNYSQFLSGLEVSKMLFFLNIGVTQDLWVTHELPLVSKTALLYHYSRTMILQEKLRQRMSRTHGIHCRHGRDTSSVLVKVFVQSGGEVTTTNQISDKNDHITSLMSTQPPTLHGIVKWVSAFGLSSNKWRWWMQTLKLTVYADLWLKLISLVQRSAAKVNRVNSCNGSAMMTLLWLLLLHDYWSYINPTRPQCIN